MNEALITLQRLGSYGMIHVDWQMGYPLVDHPQGFERGALAPESGTVSIPNGVDNKTFVVQVILSFLFSSVCIISAVNTLSYCHFMYFQFLTVYIIK